MWSITKDKNQVWQFHPDGTIRLKNFPNAALSIEEGGAKNRGRVWMWSITKDRNQVWAYYEDGTIRLRAFPQYALSMEEGGRTNKGRVWMYQITRDHNQRWNVQGVAPEQLLYVRSIAVTPVELFKKEGKAMRLIMEALRAQ